MGWSPLGRVVRRDIAFEAVAADDVWIIREQQRVIAWDGVADEVSWVCDLTVGQPMGMKPLTRCGDLVVTHEDYGVKKDNAYVGIEIGSGELAWRKKAKLRAQVRGLASKGEVVLVQGLFRKRGYHLLQLDARTGRQVADVASQAGAEVAVVGDRVLLAGDAGLHCYLGEGEWDSLALVNVKNVAVHGDQVYFYFEDPDENWARCVGWYDATSGTLKGKVKVEVESPAIHPIATPTPGRIAISPEDGQGIQMLDLEAGEVVWTVPFAAEDWGNSGVWTPHGLVVQIAHHDKAEVRVVALDEQTGEALEAPTCQAAPATVYWMDGRLLISGLDALESFEHV